MDQGARHIMVDKRARLSVVYQGAGHSVVDQGARHSVVYQRARQSAVDQGDRHSTLRGAITKKMSQIVEKVHNFLENLISRLF